MDFKVTPEYVANAATNCDSTANEIRAQLGTLRNYVVSIEAEYQGVAATTFQALMADYDRFGRMLNEALTDIGAGLRGNSNNYIEAESQNAANLAPLNTSVPSANF